MGKKQLSTSRPVRRATGGLSALLLACTLSSAQAAESLFITGAEYNSDSQYAFLAAIVPFPGSSLGNGFVQRYWLEWLEYKYDSNNRVIEAEAPGLEAALGYQKSYTGGYWGAWAGAYYKDTELSPDDPTSEARGSHTRLRTQLEAEQALGSNWRVNGILSYVFVQEAYWTRARLLHLIKGNIWAGIEGVVHGDPDYKGQQVALVFTGFEPAPRLNLGLKVGAAKIEGRSTEAVIGFELARPFGK